MNPATLTPPPDSPPMTSPEGADFSATPGPPRLISTRTAYVTPTPPPPTDAIGTPGFDWQDLTIIYGGLKLSNYDGSQKKVIPIEVAISPWNSDYSPEAGRIVTTVDTSLWTLDVGTGIQSMLSLNGSLSQYNDPICLVIGSHQDLSAHYHRS